MTKPRCEDCACWKPRTKRDGIPRGDGLCYRHPPQVVVCPEKDGYGNVVYCTDNLNPVTSGAQGCWDIVRKDEANG